MSEKENFFDFQCCLFINRKVKILYVLIENTLVLIDKKLYYTINFQVYKKNR